ncbi:hypothetical protein [Viscerimonas tarda]
MKGSGGYTISSSDESVVKVKEVIPYPKTMSMYHDMVTVLLQVSKVGKATITVSDSEHLTAVVDITVTGPTFPWSI